MVARATRPCRSATRRPEERGGLFPKAPLYWVRVRSPFRPASRRAVQASGLCYPKTNFRTRSEALAMFHGDWHAGVVKAEAKAYSNLKLAIGNGRVKVSVQSSVKGPMQLTAGDSLVRVLLGSQRRSGP